MPERHVGIGWAQRITRQSMEAVNTVRAQTAIGAAELGHQEGIRRCAQRVTVVFPVSLTGI